MKIAKRILIALAAFIGLVLVIALFVKKDYSVEREIVINRPNDEVFTYVKSLRNQPKWSTWARMDPNAKIDFTGEDGAVGSTYAWDGNDSVGKGNQVIKNIAEGQRIDIDLHFERPFPSTSPVWMLTQPVDSTQTRVTWGMSGHMPYPMNLMRLFMSMETMIGDEYQKSLQNLKGILENG